MTEERLFEQQVAKATGADGVLDMATLRQLVVGCYQDATQDRRRSDRAITLMAEELEGANRRLRALVEDLRVQNLRFEAALDNMSQGLCLYDREDRLVVVNRRYHEIMGLPPGTLTPVITHEEQLRIETGAGVHGHRSAAELLAARQAMLARAGDEARLEFFTEQGRRIDVACERLVSGGCIVTLVDVTEERAAEARAAAAARLTSLGEMAAGLAHEMKQPLTAIALAASNAERAADRGDTASLKLRLSRIAAQASRGGALIEHLRRFARGWDSNTVMDRVAVSETIEGVLTLVGGSLREASIEVLVELAPGLPLVSGHQVAIEQVLLNLVMNARDAIGGTGSHADGRIRITACGQDHGQGVLIQVADNAGGIPEAVMSRLFEPFVTTKGPDRGTGLGLSICHGLVKTMGGEISAENGPEGAIFHVLLRAAPNHAGSEISPAGSA